MPKGTRTRAYAIAEGPIDHSVRYEILVRNEMFFSIPGYDRGVAGSQGVDPTVGSVDFNDVARLDRSVQKKNESAHQIGNDFLKPEANPYANCSTKQSEGREIQADRGESHDEREKPKGHGEFWSEVLAKKEASEESS